VRVTQLDISATAIRDLLARGLSPRFLLPDAVLERIRERGLYR
jgi:nicotinate-nucleotide adenylyltransferase